MAGGAHGARPRRRGLFTGGELTSDELGAIAEATGRGGPDPGRKRRRGERAGGDQGGTLSISFDERHPVLRPGHRLRRRLMAGGATHLRAAARL